MEKGKLIVIEGVDSSGKATQADLIYRFLKDRSLNVKKITFPDYSSDSSALVKMYLKGEFGTDPEEVNPYAASVFFAADRFASFTTDWGQFYKSGGILIADRYVSSNMIYQAAKFKKQDKSDEFIEWLSDLEFSKLGLPVPDMVIFLSLPPHLCLELSDSRLNKFTGLAEKDIHESKKSYLEKTYETALRIADKYSWQKIDCSSKSGVRPIKDINSDIINIINKIL